MTTTASGVYAGVILLYALNIFQCRSFLDKNNYITFWKIPFVTCSCWASIENWLLWRSASRQWFQITIEIPLPTIQNPAVYLLVQMLASFLPWFPDYWIHIYAVYLKSCYSQIKQGFYALHALVEIRCEIWGFWNIPSLIATLGLKSEKYSHNL